MTTTNRALTKVVSASLLFLSITISAFATDIGSNQANLLQNELNRLEQIRAAGGWKKITVPKKFYQKGESGLAIKEIKDRLRVAGDFPSRDTSRIFDNDLVQAVKRAQRRFGLKENGVVDIPLVRQLNVPVEKRIDQLMVNMERLRTLPSSTGGTRLVANIPEYKLYVYEGDRVVFDMDIVVGKQENKTVIFNDEMKHIVFSPTWHVPPSIVKNEILPAMNRNRDYLWRNGYVQTGTEGGLPVIKQLPGSKNALGKVKFVFPNAHNIYFHDTQAKSLFNLNKRAFSHGCIRLAEPEKLAVYLLRNAAGWSPEKIRRAMDSGKEQFVALPAPVPVALAYFTAWVDDSGLLHFREDIYGHDAAMAKKLARS